MNVWSLIFFSVLITVLKTESYLRLTEMLLLKQKTEQSLGLQSIRQWLWNSHVNSSKCYQEVSQSWNCKDLAFWEKCGMVCVDCGKKGEHHKKKKEKCKGSSNICKKTLKEKSYSCHSVAASTKKNKSKLSGRWTNEKIGAKTHLWGLVCCFNQRNNWINQTISTIMGCFSFLSPSLLVKYSLLSVLETVNLLAIWHIKHNLLV